MARMKQAVAEAAHSAAEDASTGDVGVAAVNRALAILDAFTVGKRSLTLAELSASTGLYKSTVLRLCDSLCQFGYLQRSAIGVFTIGPRPVRLAAIYKSNLHPAEIVMPFLRTLAEQTRESAALYVQSGDVRLCAYRVSSPRSVSDNVKEGDLLPMGGASGKVLLAFAGAKGSDFDRVREDVVCVSLGEIDPELAAMACPVLDSGDELKGALTVSGPIHRFTPDVIASIRPLLVDIASQMTTCFGGDTAVFAQARRPA